VADDRKPGSMKPEEYARLERLLDEVKPSRTLEIGMANGQSAAIFCRYLRDRQINTRHVAIDPFQSSDDGWKGAGLSLIRDQRLEEYIELIEDFDYLALPRLVAQGARFDFVLIDGYHTFDYTLLDIFYADMLLRTPGVLVAHDSGWPAVYKALRFLEAYKPYERLGPALVVHNTSLFGRLARRISVALAGGEARSQAAQRRTDWHSLAAYRKRGNHLVPEGFFVEF
jgi:predicted O-methyltransferase YrrM